MRMDKIVVNRHRARGCGTLDRGGAVVDSERRLRVPRTPRSALAVRADPGSIHWAIGPGSASRHFMPRRVRDTHHSPRARLQSHQSVCAKNRISRARSTLSLLSTPSRKNIPLGSSGKSSLDVPPSRTRDEGRIAIVTDVGRGMRWMLMVSGATTLRPDETPSAYGEVVWSRCRDAGIKSATVLTHRAGDGGNQARSPRRSRRKPFNHRAGNAGLFR